MEWGENYCARGGGGGGGLGGGWGGGGGEGEIALCIAMKGKEVLGASSGGIGAGAERGEKDRRGRRNGGALLREGDRTEHRVEQEGA